LKYHTFLFDLDGTLYRGEQVIQDAPAFVTFLKNEGYHCLFVTNNSSKTPNQVAEKLESMNIPVRLQEVYTSSLATAAYIKQDAAKRLIHTPSAYIIGEEGLLAALKQAGVTITDQKPDYVIVGIDRQFNYDKLKTASQWVHQGAVLIGTNPDRALPVEGALLPGAGSIMQSVITATGIEPVWIGKPSARILEYALQAYYTGTEYEVEKILMIGDNMETDIGAATQLGIDSALTLTGFTRRDDIKKYEYRPTIVAESLTELMYVLSNHDDTK
jgi:4-nitrophenyl phosphatase